MEKDPRRSITFLGLSRSKRLFAVGLIVMAGIAWWSIRPNRLLEPSGDQLAVAQGKSVGSGRVLGTDTEEITPATFQVQVATVFSDVVRIAELSVAEGSVFAGLAEFQDEVIMRANAEVRGDLTVGGRLILNDDAFGNDIDIDIEQGTITAGTVTADNLVYSVKAGSGISVSGTQDVTISATDLGSSQKIFKNVKVNSDTITAANNEDTLTLKNGSGVNLSRSGNEITFASDNISGWVRSGSYVALVDATTSVGIGTATPTNKLEINSGTTHTSGLTFSQMTSASTVGVGGGKVLSVDSGGRVILVQDQTGDTPDAESVLPSTTTGGTLYFNGLNWVGSTNLYHNGGQVGISTTPAANSRFHVLTNAVDKVGAVIQRVVSQTANLLEFRDENGNALSYFDEEGVYHGEAELTGSITGSINPGLVQGQVAYQGASALAGSNSLFWDAGNSRLGIGTNGPSSQLHLNSSTDGTTTGITLASQYNTLKLYGRGNSPASSVIESSGSFPGITFRTGSSPADRMYLDLVGKLALGHTSPVGLFDVSGKVTGKALNILNETGNQDIFTASASGTSRFTIKNDGSVGVGTVSPSQALHVVGNLAVEGVETGTGGIAENSGRIRVGNRTNGGVTTKYLEMWSNWDTPVIQSVGYGQPLSITSSTGRISMNPISSGGTATNSNNMIFLRVGHGAGSTSNVSPAIAGSGGLGVWASDINSSLLIIDTSTAGHNRPLIEASEATVSRLYLHQDGRLGLNNSSPTGTLHVVTGSTAGKALTIFNETGDQNILTASASGTTRMVLTNNGLLGVGTTSPTSRVHVQGDLAVTDGSGNPGILRIGTNEKGLLYLTGSTLALQSNNYPITIQSIGGAFGGYIRFNLGGTEAMRLTSAGNFGIGTTAATSPLHVNAGYGSNALAAFNQLNGGDILTASASGTTRMVLSNAGRLGLNTLTPGALGDFAAPTSTVGLIVRATASGGQNAQEWYNNGNSLTAAVNNQGSFYTGSCAAVGTSSLCGSQLAVVSGSPTRPGISVSGASGQSAALLSLTGAGTIAAGTSTYMNLDLSGLVLTTNNPTINGFNISNIPTGSGVETAIKVGTGWDVAATFASGNIGLGTSTFGTSADKVLAIAGSTAPSSAITDGIQLFAVDQSGSHELRVMDEAGNITTLSPHNFSLIPEGRSEDLAWSFYSERNGLAINADMTKALRLVEKLSGEQLIYLKDLDTNQDVTPTFTQELPSAQTLLAEGEIPAVARWSYQLWSFIGEVVFEKPARFLASVVFENDVKVEGFIEQSPAAAGWAEIKAGDGEVKVTYAQAYPAQPVLTVTPTKSGVKYQLVDETTTGFTIKLEAPAAQLERFAWQAQFITSPQTTTSNGGSSPSPSPTASSSPSPSPSSAPVIASPSPTPLVSPEPSPSSQPDATPEPTASDSAGLSE
ncbi:MAG TPA: hypothetical protein VD999_03500 [Vitreimonas sp.]|nr:hypothetical protein [Vitreimonas sp.]